MVFSITPVHIKESTLIRTGRTADGRKDGNP